MRTIYKLFDSDSDNNSDGRQCCCEAELCLSNGFQRHLLIFLPNVHYYFMKHVLLRDIYCFCVHSL